MDTDGHVSVTSQVDLVNEPHASSWGFGRPETDWDKAAARLGNHVLSQCSRWLVFVEGVGHTPGAPGANSKHHSAQIFWGENLVGVADAPVELEQAGRLVFSPHAYGPSVWEMTYFEDETFPSNMDAIWQVPRLTLCSVCVRPVHPAYHRAIGPVQHL